MTTLMTVLGMGGLALLAFWSQRGRRSRGGAFSLYGLLLLGTIFLALSTLGHPAPATIQATRAALVTAEAVIGVLGFWRFGRGWWGYAPHVLSAYLFVGGIWEAFSLLAVDSGGGGAAVTPAFTPDLFFSLIAGELGIGLIALVGVGWGSGRTWPAIRQRLGLDRPLTGRGILLAIGVVVVMLGLNALLLAVDPHSQHLINQGTRSLIPRFASLPISLAAATLMALSAGVCEELLFRGALQPVYGLFLTSLLFASQHNEYGWLTAGTALILIMGLLFGLLRRFYGTKTAILAHILYDLPVMFLAALALRG